MARPQWPMTETILGHFKCGVIRISGWRGSECEADLLVGSGRHIWRKCRPKRRQCHLSLATARVGLRELTPRCNQAGLRPTQISRPRGFIHLTDRSELVTRRLLRVDGTVGAGADL